MIFPADTIIARQKLTHYLLRLRDDHDKSGFLALAGYDLRQADRLEKDLREQLLPLVADFAEANPYGEKYVIRGTLTGPNVSVRPAPTICGGVAAGRVSG